ncbi:MAG: hypothetical protein JWQ33_739 [Ramlibacter sp.]|nr:hypothetical protein [Ramlibacter sp.]
MSEWWTYELSDFLMFSVRTWQRTLELHNRDWFPQQGLGTLAAAGLLWALGRRTQWTLRAALLVLALGWAFVAWAFHWQRYAAINWAAAWFAVGFAAQALVLAWQTSARTPLVLVSDDARGSVGVGLMAAALLYPLLALVLGRPVSQSEWFALMPDPTVLATLGLLLCLRARWPLLTMAVPLLWCAVTGATLWTLKAPEWFALPLAGVLAVLAVVIVPRAAPPSAPRRYPAGR